MDKLPVSKFRIVELPQGHNIAKFAWNPNTGTLRVSFSGGGRYEYKNVPADKFGAMCSAESVGSYFCNAIKPHHECKKLEGGCIDQEEVA